MPIFNKRLFFIILILLAAALIASVALIILKNKKPASSPAQTTVDLKKAVYKCPSLKKFCESGKSIVKGTNYEGFGMDVATGSAILASFDGIATGTTITLPDQFKNEKLNVIYLDNQENKLRATYYFKGESVNFNNLTVKEGTILGKSGGRMLYYNTSLLFTLTSSNPPTELIMLDPKDFI